MGVPRQACTLVPRQACEMCLNNNVVLSPNKFAPTCPDKPALWSPDKLAPLSPDNLAKLFPRNNVAKSLNKFVRTNALTLTGAKYATKQPNVSELVYLKYNENNYRALQLMVHLVTLLLTYSQETE